MASKTVAILCAHENGVYRTLNERRQLDLDRPRSSGCLPLAVVYGRKRGARTFSGGMPVVAHPPCRLWAGLSHFCDLPAVAVAEEKMLGLFCAAQVVANGGVLEHPFNSRLFPAAGLPPGGCQNEKGFTLEIPQRMFGHAMIKNTWLFFAGLALAEIDPIRPVLHGLPLKAIQSLSAKQREATPVLLAEWLLVQAAKAVPWKLVPSE